MAKAERIEDLGRLREILRDMLSHDPFLGQEYPCRNKDFIDYFYEQTPDQQHNILHDYIYGLDNLKNKLYECLAIACGEVDDDE
jgi:hypothetical protein